MEYNFEWDLVKARINQKKHGITFESAVVVFNDPRALTVHDLEHSDLEERWVTMGMIGNCCICVVHHTFKDVSVSSVVIRIFSARKATKNEQRQYWEK